MPDPGRYDVYPRGGSGTLRFQEVRGTLDHLLDSDELHADWVAQGTLGGRGHGVARTACEVLSMHPNWSSRSIRSVDGGVSGPIDRDKWTT